MTTDAVTSTRPTRNLIHKLQNVEASVLRTDIPDFSAGDTIRVHAKIVEGAKERVQIFEGVVLMRQKGNLPRATFTVRKVSYNVGVERTFLLHSPRIEKIELVAVGEVRRARLFYLRDLRGKAARIRSVSVDSGSAAETSAPVAEATSPVAAA